MRADDWHSAADDLDGLARDLGAEPSPNGAARCDNGAADDLPLINVAEWEGQQVPPREWAVPERIPLRTVTLVSGEGGGGKSTLVKQLLTGTVLGRHWLDTMPEPGPALYLNAEDELDEVHRRLADISAHYGASFANLRDLHLLCFAGKDAVLGAPDRSGIVRPTALFPRIREAALDLRPKIIALDTSADIFAGNENDRGQVRQFVGMLRGLAIEANAAVMVCSHPSLSGITSGSGLSGSTAWHNSVRARIYIKAAATADGEEPDPDLREVQFKKNNYGPIASSLIVRWRDGVFVVEGNTGGGSFLDRLAADKHADDLFLKLLDRFNLQGRNVSHKKGPTYGPAMFAREAQAKEAGIRRDAFERAMTRLFAANAIHVEPYGPPCRGTSKLVSGSVG